MVCILATLSIQDGKQADFEKVFGELARAVRENEPGNVFYQLCREGDDATKYLVMEGYVDADAVEAHRKSAHFIAAGKDLGNLLAAPPDIKVMEGAG